METLDVKIKEISDRPDTKTSPVIGYFPSGYDPLKKSNDRGFESEPFSSVTVYRSVNSRNPRNPRMQVVVGPRGSLVNFVGTNYSGEASTPQLCNYALGVLDKEAGVLKMVPIAGNKILRTSGDSVLFSWRLYDDPYFISCYFGNGDKEKNHSKQSIFFLAPYEVQIFRLEPKVGGMEQLEDEPVDGDKEEITKEEKNNKFKHLTVMYSTKRNVKRDVTREKLRQTEEPGMEGNQEQKLKGIQINTKAIEAIASTANERNIPPYDVEATSPEMAYPLDHIILKGDWNYLVDIFELVEAGSDVRHDLYPSFVCNRVHKIRAIKDESKRKRMAGILSYITHLINYKDKHSMDGVSSSKRRHKLPNILGQKFASLFGPTKEKRIPDEKQQLLTNYVLVLTLFADDFRSDPMDISKDLRISFVSLRPHYEFLGCKFVSEEKEWRAILPVPLKFQTIKRKRRN